MRTAADIIELWPSAERFAADIGLKYPSYARVMKLRGRIPRRYWPAALSAAEARGLDLTANELETHQPAPRDPSADLARAS